MLGQTEDTYAHCLMYLPGLVKPARPPAGGRRYSYQWSLEVLDTIPRTWPRILLPERGGGKNITEMRSTSAAQDQDR
jgi:hypothetical protein